MIICRRPVTEATRSDRQALTTWSASALGPQCVRPVGQTQRRRVVETTRINGCRRSANGQGNSLQCFFSMDGVRLDPATLMADVDRPMMVDGVLHCSPHLLHTCCRAQKPNRSRCQGMLQPTRHTMWVCPCICTVTECITHTTSSLCPPLPRYCYEPLTSLVLLFIIYIPTWKLKKRNEMTSGTHMSAICGFF